MAEKNELTSEKLHLSVEHIIQICTAFASLDIRKIKITGGEPLMRKDIADIVRSVKNIDGIKKVTLTTNGILLPQVLEDLSSRELDGINISLDSLDANSYKAITRRGSVNDSLSGLNFALNRGFSNIKINCVVIEGLNDQEIENIAALAFDKNIAVRFIEIMPMGFAKQHKLVPQDQIVMRLEKHFGQLVPCSGNFGNGPAVYYKLPDFCGKIGFISAVSHKFCTSCNRVRLTAAGHLKTCLHFRNGVDLRTLLENKVSQAELICHIENAILQKPVGHAFCSSFSEYEEEFADMSHIGG